MSASAFATVEELAFEPAHISLETAAALSAGFDVWAVARPAGQRGGGLGGEIYRRALALDGKVVEVAVAQTGQTGLPYAPRLEVMAPGVRLSPGMKSAVTEALDRLLGLKVDLSGFYRLAAADRRLRPLAERF